MKIEAFCFAVVALHPLVSLARTEGPELAAETAVKILKRPGAVQPVCRVQAATWRAELVKKLGLPEAAAAAGRPELPCGRGDFNGDGRQDYFFYRCANSALGAKGESCDVLVFLTKPAGAFESVMLDPAPAVPPVTYDARLQRAKAKAFGCPVMRHDGLFEEGEGGASRVYEYQAGRIAVKGGCRSENN
jgi:hypothetical protein